MIQNKIINQTELIKSKGILQKPIVFTNGVFDILHNGHTQYLEDAKNHGNTLIVALNSDSSVRMLNKSPERPFNKLSNRKEVIASLASVDYVTEFDQKTPLSLISKLKPDIYIKGGDYNMDDLEEARLVSLAKQNHELKKQEDQIKANAEAAKNLGKILLSHIKI